MSRFAIGICCALAVLIWASSAQAKPADLPTDVRVLCDYEEEVDSMEAEEPASSSRVEASARAGDWAWLRRAADWSSSLLVEVKITQASWRLWCSSSLGTFALAWGE